MMKKICCTAMLSYLFVYSFSQTNFKIENNQLIIPDSLQIVFETGSANLLPQSKGAIDYVASFLINKTYISTLRIEVHLAKQSNEAFTQKLTEERALAVSKALATLVDCKRLIAVGFGSTKPIATNTTMEDRLKNNRTSFYIASLRGRAIGGMPIDGGGFVAGDVCNDIK